PPPGGTSSLPEWPGPMSTTGARPRPIGSVARARSRRNWHTSSGSSASSNSIAATRTQGLAVATAAPPKPSSATSLDTRFFGHPWGLSTLFFTEMWERFSYYGMRALLILFMTAPVAAGGLGFDTAKAGPIYALYVSSVYLLSLPGGWVADRVLGLRRAVFAGGVIIMSGHICLAIPSMSTFYLGLVLIALGTGMLKGNVAALVG